VGKLTSLPMQLAIPIVPILTAPFVPPAAVWGLETLYNCLPQLGNGRTTDHDLETGNNDHTAPRSKEGPNLDSSIPHSEISRTEYGENSHIHVAAATGDVNGVRSLINGSADPVNTRNKAGQTPLHAAASNGHRAVVEVLLDNNAEFNSRDWQGATPLQMALKNGQKDIVDLSRQRGAKE
jgi:ankyrin repeat protein